LTLEYIRRLACQMQALEQVHDSVVATDLEGTIASWNLGAERLHGYSAEEAIGRRLCFLFAPEEQAELLPRLRAGILEQGFGDLTATIVTKSGQRRILHSRLSLVRDEMGKPVGILSFAIDTTDLERVRGELQERERQRRQQEQRLRDALISEVHHRVQNNLQSIVGLLRLEVQQHPELGKSLQPAIAKLMAVSVGFGLMSTSAARGLNLCDMTREIAHHLSEVTGVRIETNLDDAVREQPVKVEERHAVNVALVINELILNAVKYAHSDGAAVTVSILRERSALAAATVRIFSPGARLPPHFDFDGAVGLRTGLTLVRLLMPAQIAQLRFDGRPEGVIAELRLVGSSSQTAPV
jgi:PAS domain S-box-containing protein